MLQHVVVVHRDVVPCGVMVIALGVLKLTHVNPNQVRYTSTFVLTFSSHVSLILAKNRNEDEIEEEGGKEESSPDQVQKKTSGKDR